MISQIAVKGSVLSKTFAYKFNTKQIDKYARFNLFASSIFDLHAVCLFISNHNFSQGLYKSSIKDIFNKCQH